MATKQVLPTLNGVEIRQPIEYSNYLCHAGSTNQRRQSAATRVRVLPASSIARHVLEHKHRVDTSCFRIVHKASDGKLLKFAEAIAIARLNPTLCKQKDQVMSLALPW